MKYIIIDQKGNITITEDSKEVDKTLFAKEGIFYVISIYPNFVTCEQYQVHNKKIYEINAINM